MRAARYDRFRGPIEIVEVPDPCAAPGDVVVEVLTVGLCRSDVHGWHGTDPDIVCPHVGGHEFVGRVVALGAGVERVGLGQRIVVPFVCGCGRCEPCRAGQHQVCRHQEQPGFTRWGAFAERTTIPYADVNAVVVPDTISDEAAALVGCRWSTAYRGVVERGRVQAGETVAVHGCGGVGLAAVALGRALGARVLALDVDPAALALARRLGATETVATIPGDPAATANIVADLGGAHVSLDCIGHPDAANASILGLRPLGRHVQIGLFPAATAPLAIARVIRDELEILGVHGLSASRLGEVLALVEAGRLDPTAVVTRRLRLDDLPEVLPAMGRASRGGTFPGPTSPAATSPAATSPGVTVLVPR
ncbi:MAG: alcohol dehydrogenase catalytic domain-containing protein [Acidimicrobiales bacterium]